MPANPSSPEIPLPRGWPSRVKSAILHVISLAQFTLAYTRGWAANSPNSRIRLKAELDRAGVHLGATTVGRILKEGPIPKPTEDKKKDGKNRVVTSKCPNNLWQMDLSVVPIGPGLWTTWQPFSLPQCWPFGWWLGVILDHYSRRIMGITLFAREPTSEAMRAFLGRTIHATGVTPRHLVTDQGPQFSRDKFEPWCQRKGIRPRFGAIGEHGSIAVIERLILTLKQSIAWLTLVPLRRRAFLRELRYLAAWYNSHRPHMTLGGRTPDEVYHRLGPISRQPRFEPRANWPRSSPCAKPVTLVKGRPGARLEMDVQFSGGRRHLPVVSLRRAAYLPTLRFRRPNACGLRRRSLQPVAAPNMLRQKPYRWASHAALIANCRHLAPHPPPKWGPKLRGPAQWQAMGKATSSNRLGNRAAESSSADEEAMPQSVDTTGFTK